jgi:UDP-N-acetylmuramoyl-tripeptide--D-alanyl-D-alanine ligase
MEHHLQMMQPLVGVLLSVSDVHAANYHSAHPREAIAREKAKLLQALPQNGLAVASCDYPEIVQSATGISAPMVWFSREESGGDTHGAAPLNVQCRLLAYHLTPTGTTFTLSFEGTTYTLAFSNQVHSRGSFGSFAAALIVGKFAGVAPEVALSALSQHMQLPPGRMSVLAGLRGATLLDSSYNASPDSMRDALQLLQQFPTTGRRIVILGDMRELGVSSAVAHESIGQAALSVADVIVLVGPEMGDHAWPVIQSADDDARRKLQKVSPHRWYTNAYAALEYVQDLVQANDVVLIKGSQNTIFLEILVAALLAHPERDRAKLCRQDAFWESQRVLLKTRRG